MAWEAKKYLIPFKIFPEVHTGYRLICPVCNAESLCAFRTRPYTKGELEYAAEHGVNLKPTYIESGEWANGSLSILPEIAHCCSSGKNLFLIKKGKIFLS